MTPYCTQTQQAGSGPRPSFQSTTCFVNKIRDSDRWTKRVHHTYKLGWLLMSLFMLLFLPPSPIVSISSAMSFSFLHASLHFLLLPPPTHHLSLLALDTNSDWTSLIFMIPSSLWWGINMKMNKYKICYQTGVAYNISAITMIIKNC